MKWFAGITMLCVVAISAGAQSNSVTPRPPIDTEHTKWLAGAMSSMQSIRVGMTRSDLLTVFAEGGLSTPSQRTYVYRQCLYIKVDVKFAAASPSEESPTDKIVQISQPYLAWITAD